MYSLYEKVYRLESAINKVNECDEHLSDSIRNNWKKTISEELIPFKQYGGEIEEKVDYICTQYCSNEGVDLNNMSDIAFDKLCECITELTYLINNGLGE